MSNDYRYHQRGVSTQKEEVHEAVQKLEQGLYPNAFCKVFPDYWEEDDDYCIVMSSDTAGTKPILAYLYWKETGNTSIWKNIAQDAIVMNLDDLACVGVTDQILFTSTIGRNPFHIPGDVISTLIRSSADFLNSLEEWNIRAHLTGGETADVGDIVRTVDVGFTAVTRMPREDLVINDIQPGNVIVGLGSSQQASYEDRYNSGIGCNGLTSARHDVLTHKYAEQYPESFDPTMDEHLVYAGNKELTDIDEETGESVGQLLLSPTRTYLPVLREVLDNYREQVDGLIHCTGGGQTKVLHFIEDIHVVKDQLFPVPPVFKMIRVNASTPWREMYEVFNMGHRMEIYTSEAVADDIIAIADKYDIAAKVVGHCEKDNKSGVTIKSPEGDLHYPRET